MITEQNKKIILRLFDEGITQRNFQVFNELISENFLSHGLLNPYPGPSGFKSIVQPFLIGFPDMQITVQHIIAEKDSVATKGFFTGTHDGNFMGLSPTGKKINIDYMDFWKIANGKCIENWIHVDMARIMQEIGPIQMAL